MVQNPEAPDGWFRFHDVRQVLCADRIEDVASVLERASEATDTGMYAVGFLTYEAAAAMDEALCTREASNLPFAWFAICSECESTQLPSPCADSPFSTGEWTASMHPEEYSSSITRIKGFLAGGETYQVNFTFQLNADFYGDPYGLFSRMTLAQQARYGAFIETDSFAICSASPELFLSRAGDILMSRPMKGTARRGMTTEEDRLIASDLHASQKNRAENVMIVDMVRNDMGRVAVPGSVVVRDLYEVERYPTVWQMTSRVECRSMASFPEIFRALFPCASITGAPKVRTMHLIRSLETRPRGVYTGCAGFLAPGGKMQFNVAIRTVTIDKHAGKASYGVGSGVVWDSIHDAEHKECLLKANVLREETPEFELLETLLWEPGNGFFLVDEHLKRLLDSAEYFCFPVDEMDLRRRLDDLEATASGDPLRVRILLTRNGDITVESRDAEASTGENTWLVKFADNPVNKTDKFLYHKTTNRTVYNTARDACPQYDDVILWNTDGKVTESSIANIVIERGGRLITPPVSCGLLDGTFRRHLLKKGRIEEECIRIEDLANADRLFLINSVRKWIPARLVS